VSAQVNPRRTLIPAAGWFLLIMILLSLPGESFERVRIDLSDKLAHILLFAGQLLLFWIALELPRPRFRSHRHSLAVAAAFTLLFGLLSEPYQAVFTSRMADPYDAIANGIGVLFAGLLIRFFPQAILRFAQKFYRLESPKKK